jgi:hypothetical protein
MYYSEKVANQIKTACEKVLTNLEQLHHNSARHSERLVQGTKLQEHLLHGVARRVAVIRRSIQNIFSIFPLETQEKLTLDQLWDVQINLHAFMINLSGIFDNWAWVYVLRHNLEAEIGGRKKIGLFLESTRCRLPTELNVYLSDPMRTQWHDEYVKSFRDALAHRIPLYIPPAAYTGADGVRLKELDTKIFESIQRMDWDGMNDAGLEQSKIGSPCFHFLHSHAEKTAPGPVGIHIQILNDAAAIVEFGSLFLEHCEKPPSSVKQKS